MKRLINEIKRLPTPTSVEDAHQQELQFLIDALIRKAQECNLSIVIELKVKEVTNEQQ